MFNQLMHIFSVTPLKGVYITLTSLIILGFSLWVSYDDLKSKQVYFWKMLLLGSSVVLTIAIYSLFSGNGWKFIVTMVAGIPLYILFLYLNILFNKERWFGKADVDIVASYVTTGIMFSVWAFWDKAHSQYMVSIPYIWSYISGSMAIGLIIGLVMFLINWEIMVLKKQRTWYTAIGTPIAALPMFVIPNVMIPLAVMMF